MFEKIASISDAADKYGSFELADELDGFVKTAGILDALWALVNPKNYGMDKDDRWMRRLQRGFLQGKLEKKLARSMSKLIEVGRYERAIAEEAAPLKEFIEDITKVYDSIFKPGAKPDEIKKALSTLRASLRGAQRNFSGSKLAKLVEKRERLVRDAIETMREAKIPDEMKKKLIELTGNPALLEQIAQSMEEAAQNVKEEVKEPKKEEESIPMDVSRFLKKEEPKPAAPKVEPKLEPATPALPQEMPPVKVEAPAEMVQAPASEPVKPIPNKPPRKKTEPKIPALFPEGGKSGFVSRKLERLEKLADMDILDKN
jgi:hypothetical protein